MSDDHHHPAGRGGLRRTPGPPGRRRGPDAPAVGGGPPRDAPAGRRQPPDAPAGRRQPPDAPAGRRRSSDPASRRHRSRRGIGLSAVLQRSILIVAGMAMLLFGAPLAVAVNPLYQSEAVSEVAHAAERTHAAVAQVVLGGSTSLPTQLPTTQSHEITVGVYDAAGRLRSGYGPSTPEAVVADVARDRVEQESVVGGLIVVAVPVVAEREGVPSVAYVVRASTPYAEVRARTYVTWAVMVGLAMVVLVVVVTVGRSRARRIAQPLQALAGAADALGQGDFSVRAVHSGLTEVDEVSDNLERTARRLGAVLERERAFSADASHQLRTPLTAVRIGLEAALLTPGADLRAAVDDALVGLDRLEQTVLDLLTLARDTSGPRESADVAALAADTARHWRRVLREHGRELALGAEPDLPRARVSKPALRTVLDVLLGNALAHGAGEVRLVVRATESTVTVEVSDEGPGVSGDGAQIFARRSAEATGTGIGLALARSLVEADGGRLELTSPCPATFTLLLPVARTAGGRAIRDSGQIPSVS